MITFRADPATPSGPQTPASGSRGGRWRDTAAGALLAAAFLAGSLWCYRQVAPAVLHPVTFDHWFESDAPNVKVAMLDRWSGVHWRAGRHPLAPIAQYAPTFVAHRLLGMSEDAAVGVVTALIAALLGGTLFVLLRAMGLGRGGAVLFTLLAGSSAAVVFWAGVPELYVLTAVSLTPVLSLAAWSARGGRVAFPAWVVAAAATLAFSTNAWAVGLLALLLFLPWRRAVPAAALSFLLVLGLWRVERALFPHVPSFLATPEIGTAFLFTPLGGGPFARLGSYLFHGMVLPAPGHSLGTYLTVQRAVPGVGGPMYVIAFGAWLALLGGGMWAAFRGPVRRLSALAGVALVSQLAFYQAFGMETFLYSAESVPLLLAFTAPLALTPLRRIACALAAVLVLAGGANNVTRFRESARDVVAWYGKERAFAGRVAALTDAGPPLVYGDRYAAAEGLVEVPALSSGEPRPVWYLGLFPELGAARAGWQVPCDAWSLDVIESYRARGAAYFVSSYGYGLAANAALVDELDARYGCLERTADHVICALEPEVGR